MKRLLKKLVVLFTAAVTAINVSACSSNGNNSGDSDIMKTAIIENVTPLSERLNVKNALCGKDALGREISPAGENGNGRLVGLFYTLWLGNYYSDEGQSYFPDEILDMSEMSFSYLYSGGGSPFVKMHFYAQPLFGYYNQRDVWVVEKHVQMFIAADIDFLGIDATNNDFYPAPLEVLLNVLEAYRLEGYKVPKIMFLTNTDSSKRVTEIYEYLYENNRYENLWFDDDDNGANPERKPWITIKTGETIYLKNAVKNKFYFRDSQWPNESFKENGFPWIEFTRPQPVHNGVISVSVAQNNGMHMSTSVQYENSPNGNDYYNMNWGRGYSSEDGKNSKNRVDAGSNFQEQWDVAVSSDARIAFVLEWNEWAALKLAARVEGIGTAVVFFDCASPEFSRDIEPIKGYYGDNFYMQLIANVRRFKGESGSGIAADRASFVNGKVDWNDVGSGIADFAGQKRRSYPNCNESEYYENNTKRNDINEIRVAYDDENIYVLLTCAENVTVADDADWMNLYFRTKAEAAPCGYDIAVNRARKGNKAEVTDLLTGEVLGRAECAVSGRYVQFVIPAGLIGAEFELKATDNVNFLTDVMKLYTEGDSAPYGRLNYKFKAAR